MDKESLTALGLSEESAEKVLEELNKAIAEVRGESGALTAERDAANARIEELSRAVKQFEGVDINGLKQQITDLQTKYDTDTASLRRDHAIETAIAASKPRDQTAAKALRALLDQDAIQFKDGKLVGLEEQIEGFRKDNGYLFEGSAPTHKLVAGAAGKVTEMDPFNAFTASARAAAGLKQSTEKEN